MIFKIEFFNNINILNNILKIYLYNILILYIRKMPIEFKEIYNNSINYVTNNRGVKAITNNPLSLGITIALIIVLIIAFEFREVETEEGVFKMALRTGLYSSVFIIGLIFLYDRNIQESHKKDYSGGLMEEVFNEVDNAAPMFVEGGIGSTIGVTIRDPMFTK